MAGGGSLPARLELASLPFRIDLAAHLLVGRLNLFWRNSVFLEGRGRSDEKIPNGILDGRRKVLVPAAGDLGLDCFAGWLRMRNIAPRTVLPMVSLFAQFYFPAPNELRWVLRLGLFLKTAIDPRANCGR